MLIAVDSIREDALPGLDTTTPNVARMYDYLLGGKDNFAADRAAAEQLPRGAGCARRGLARRSHGLGHGAPTAGGVPCVWKDSMVFRPHACPLARSASVQLTGCQSGARTSRAPAVHSSMRLPPGSYT
jgi:S-adenosyl methyltransferase